VIKFDRKSTQFSTGILTAFLLLAGCATSGSTVPAGECPVPGHLASEYVIGSGDTLQVVIWRNNELSAELPVRPDGKISTPLIDDMQAAGKTPTDLAKDMEIVLSEFLRSPEVSVIVTGQGASNQLQVVGEVAVPQAMSYRQNLRVLDLIVGVGGLADFAAGNRTNLVRETDAGQIKCKIRLNDLLAGDMSQNILVFPGDVLIVPETRF
jgi:polysaccharide biosynthesis/export protein